MATKLYTGDVKTLKHVDWAGDNNTQGLPVSGELIQQYIKETLNSKFGYLYFDKDPISGFSNTGSNKYLIFSDEEDYQKWASNPTDYASLVLGSFDAPAPATIEIVRTEDCPQNQTVLEMDKDKAFIKFKYIVKQSSGSSIQSPMTYTISINNSISGITNLPSRTLGYDAYNEDTEHQNADEKYGIFKFENIGQYLKSGTNTITITLTSDLYNVSTVIIYQYNLLNLNLSSTFNYANGISLDTNDYLVMNITAEGGSNSNKILNVYIDGEILNDLSERQGADLFIGNGNNVTYELSIPLKNNDGTDRYTTGQHSLQMFFYINDNNNIIKSKTLFYNFVLTKKVNGVTEHRSYILFEDQFDEGTIIPQDYDMSIEVEQYSPISIKYSVFDTTGSGNTSDGKCSIEIELKGKESEDSENYTELLWSTTTSVASKETAILEYTTQVAGQALLTIRNTNNDKVNNQWPVGTYKNIYVNIKPSSINITEPSNLLLELSALNRSNNETYEKRVDWHYDWISQGQTKHYQVEFNNVLWNYQNGWGNNCLVLNSGATMTVPNMNIFAQHNRYGVTFEIDFETENVQDDDAIIMTYGNTDEEGNLISEGIQIKACSAELKSTKNSIHTNYKDGARQKIQFVFGYNDDDESIGLSQQMPYMMYIVVNGILDRVAEFKKNDIIGTTTEGFEGFTIGNLNNKVGIKIYSLRVYRRALTLDECLDNCIRDNALKDINGNYDIRKSYNRNDVYKEGSTSILDIDKLLGENVNVPTMIIYGDVSNSIVTKFNKKANVPVDVLYRDPNHPHLNFFAHDCWLSNQGTSSMNYPRRNLRLYFNKKSDENTLYGYASKARYDYATRVWWGLTDEVTISNIQHAGIGENPIYTESDLNNPIEVNGKTYAPFFNKKAKKTKSLSREIDYGTAVMFMHSGIKVFSDAEATTKIKNLNKFVKDNPGAPIYTQGAYTRFKDGTYDNEPSSLFTDRWTLKCDYAESSMCHNAGVGRLWGDVMKNVEVTDGFRYDLNGVRIADNHPGLTNAQAAVKKYDEAHKGQKITVNGKEQNLVFGDIRTSCDGYPIIIINKPRIIDENNEYTEDFGDPVFLGLYNIMTDKGSTPLFGFEDLKDEEGKALEGFETADNVECWECLQNGSGLAQMNSIISDDTDGSLAKYTTKVDENGKWIDGTGSDNKNRILFESYEARWPDNDDLNNTCTNNLETVIRFVNFCKDAVTITVDGRDAYKLSDFKLLTDAQAEELSQYNTAAAANAAAQEIGNPLEGLDLSKWDGIIYQEVFGESPKEKTSKFATGETDSTGRPVYMNPDNSEDMNTMIGIIKNDIYYVQDYNSQNVTGSTFVALFDLTNTPNVQDRVRIIINTLKTGSAVYTLSLDETKIEYVASEYDSNISGVWYILDKSYDRSKITKVINTAKLTDEVITGRVHTYDGKRKNNEGEDLHPDAWVTVYLTRSGSAGFTYTDEMGNENVRYASGEDWTEEVGTTNHNGSFKGETLMTYFKDKKYEHFDIWKLACYYIYLMRFAAVDQVIKNTMMTTEDGKHWYFINYDNDTTLGVRNDGYLAYDWKIDRETYDDSIGAYAYAGFGSVLWNLLEQDDDFMNKVQIVANAMVTSKVLTYDIALNMFNVKQAGTWCERLYNNSELYKYIGIYTDIDNEGKENRNPFSNSRYLPFLQGSRASHREWWLRHRFDFYDSKWGAGEYADAFIQIYYNIQAGPGNAQKELFTMKAATKFYYTVQDVHHLTLNNNFIELEQGQTWSPKTASSLAGVSDPIVVLGGYNMEVIDFSAQRECLQESGMIITWDENKYTSRVKQLIIGGDKNTDEHPASPLGVINGIEKLSSLELLDVRYCTKLTNLDLTNLTALNTFLATGSAISSFMPAEGLMLQKVSLPIGIQSIKINNLDLEELDYEPNRFLKSFEANNITGSALEGHKLFEFILKWYLSIKKSGINVRTYKCNVSFSNFEMLKTYNSKDYSGIEVLPSNLLQDVEIDGTTYKEISAINLINQIRNDFGVSIDENNNISYNFVINSGVITIYGNAANDGLTEEDYYALKNTLYNNIGDRKVNLWDANVFTATQPFHFNSNTSVFISLTDTEDRDTNYIYKDATETYTWHVVSGNTVKLRVTMFPSNVNRRFKYIPKSITENKTWYHNADFSQYYLNESTLTNNNDTALISLAEHLTLDKMHRINISEVIDDITTPIAEIDIIADKITKPDYDDFYYTRMDGDVEKNVNYMTNDILKAIVPYEYTVNFKLDGEQTEYNEKYNIDIYDIQPSFTNNTDVPVQESSLGTLEAVKEVDAENPDKSVFKVVYTPKIEEEAFGEENAKVFSVYLWTTFNDSQKSVIKSPYISIRLQKQDIQSIDLSFNGNIANDTIEHYITEYSSNTTLIKYNYKVLINPDDFNVPITNMSISVDNDAEFEVVPTLVENNYIKEFSLQKSVFRNNTFHNEGQITINVETEFTSTPITRTYNVIIGMYCPDKVELIRTNHNNNIDKVYNNSNKLTLLSGNSREEYDYEFHIYSRINDKLYVWGDNEDIVSYNEENHNYYLTSNKTPQLSKCILKLSQDSDKEYNNIFDTDLDISFTGNINIPNLENNNKSSFGIIISDTSLIYCGCVLRYEIEALGKSIIYNEDFIVERIAALSINYQLTDAIKHNIETVTDPAEENSGIYFLDRNLNIYDVDGLNNQMQNIGSYKIDEFFINMLFVYDDNGTKKCISIDPWKLGMHYYWFDYNSTMRTQGTPNGYRSFLLNDNNLIYTITGNTNSSKGDIITEETINNITYYEININYSLPYIYNKCYEYYKAISLIGDINSNNPYNAANGNAYPFTIKVNTSHPDYTADYVQPAINTSQFFADLGNNKISIIPDLRKDQNATSDYGVNTDTHEDMILAHIKDYEALGINNLVCMPLSSKEVIRIFMNYNIIKKGLDKFYDICVKNYKSYGNQYFKNIYNLNFQTIPSFGELLYNNLLVLGSEFNDIEENDYATLPDIVDNSLRNPQDNNYNHENVISQIFWTFDIEDLMRQNVGVSNTFQKSFVQIFKKANNDFIIVSNFGVSGIGKTRLHTRFKCCCLFGAYTLLK